LKIASKVWLRVVDFGAAGAAEGSLYSLIQGHPS